MVQVTSKNWLIQRIKRLFVLAYGDSNENTEVKVDWSEVFSS